MSLGSGGDLRVEAELDDQPSGLGWLPDGRLLIVAMHQRAVMRREPDGKLVLHADLSTICAGDANDMVVNTDGTAYVGSFPGVIGTGGVSLSDLAMARPDGSVEVAAKDLTFPNGSVITP